MMRNTSLDLEDFGRNATHWYQRKRESVFSTLPEDVPPLLKGVLSEVGISKLYQHQNDCWRLIQDGYHVVVSTGTSSGKTLCYQLPILQAMMKSANSTSLLIYPTKALAEDQFCKFQILMDRVIQLDPRLTTMKAFVYDGDTPAGRRKQIRSKTNLLLTNPDMLHVGILPHHTMWAHFLKNLQFIVIDEVHVYRGVLGSHFGNILRRLKRILNFYGSHPQFILTSATIANPNEFCEKLIGEEVMVIDEDASSQEARHYFFVNPPIIDPSLGLREGMVAQTLKLSEKLIKEEIQTLIFARSRRTVEITLLELRQRLGENFKLDGYRSGYLKTERRQIEEGLRAGDSSAVISTNALELGIDMGKVDAVIMMGYPGTISAFYQRSGRAGRRKSTAYVFMVASQSPIDQYMISHPDFLAQKNPENALIDPDNPLILLNQIKCSLFELPFIHPFTYGNLNAEVLKKYLEILCSMGVARKHGDNYHWFASSYPAGQISIRNITDNPIILRIQNEIENIQIGEVDYQSALRMVHPGAVYLHNGDLYHVEALDLKKEIALLTPHNNDYITEANSEADVEIQYAFSHGGRINCTFHFDEMKITEKITSYKKINWQTHELLGTYNLDMPETVLLTKGFWIGFNERLVKNLEERNLWNNQPNNYGPKWPQIRMDVIQRDGYRCQLCGLSYPGAALHVHHKIPFRRFSDSNQANQKSNLVTLCSRCHRTVERNVRMRSGLSGFAYIFSNLAPIYLMCDARDLGTYFESASKNNNGQPAVYVYDQFPGGIGLSAKLFTVAEKVLQQSLATIVQCACADGCPACVGPAGENGEGVKELTSVIIHEILK